MQRCPLAGSNCGLMVWAKPWEASEVARQSLLGHGPVFVGLAPAPDSVPLSGRPDQRWAWMAAFSSGCSCPARLTSATLAENVSSVSLSSFFCLKILKSPHRSSSLSLPFPTVHLSLPPPISFFSIHPVCTLPYPNLSYSAPHLSDCWGEWTGEEGGETQGWGG